MKTIFLTLAIWLLATTAWGQDLTPSVNFFSFDYNGADLPAVLDSIYAGRYEALVAGLGSGGWAGKYTDIYAYDTILFYAYVDLHDAWANSGYIGEVSALVGPNMADSTNLYWHSQDSAATDTRWVLPYSESEPGSRFETYVDRRLINMTASDFATKYAAHYADSLSAYLLAAGWPIVSGFWGDNMTIPQVLRMTDCPGGRPRMWEDNLGDDALAGCEPYTAWQAAYRDTQLVKYLGILGDTLEGRGWELNVNSLWWGGVVDGTAYGYHVEYDDTTKCGSVSRTHEFGAVAYSEPGEFLFPGPTNAAASIDSATIGAQYDPQGFYKRFVDLAIFGEEKWFNPKDVASDRHYGWSKGWYDELCLHYLIKSTSTYLSFAVGPNYGELNWLTGDDDADCDTAGTDNDSCYWIGALGVSVGRTDDSGWNSDTVRMYAASVTCNECIITAGVGKDDAAQNYVVYSRQWSGDDSYIYLVLHRTPGDNQSTFTGSDAPPFALPSGNWGRLGIDGSWGSAITEDSLRNGEGGIYRQLAEVGTTLKLGATYLKAGKIGE